MATMYCLKLTKEIYINDITEKEAEKILNNMVKEEFNSKYNKIEIHSELQLCI